ncbi:MAG: tetratricopeptide repeat protein [Ruminococcaceae bacterium]|nr:tetratricopeptide repeat protein [Oscillospiraceae bacterium]
MKKLLLPILIIGLTIWLFASNQPLWACILLLIVAVYLFFSKYANFCMGMALRQYGNGQVEKAFKWFKKAEKSGLNGRQKITYAYYLMREGKTEESEAIFTRMLAFKLTPDMKNLAKSNYAILLMKTGRIDEAREELEEIFPTYRVTNVYGSLGYLYILGDDMEKAKEFNHEAYDFNKDNAIILDNMVQLYTKLGDYEAAYQYVCELMEKKPAFIEAYYNAAMVEKELGKFCDAKAHLEHALTIRPTFLTTVTHENLQDAIDSLPA